MPKTYSKKILANLHKIDIKIHEHKDKIFMFDVSSPSISIKNENIKVGFACNYFGDFEQQLKKYIINNYSIPVNGLDKLAMILEDLI